MRSYQECIASLQPEDIFHAGRASGASAPCLVLSISETRITARRVTTQEIFEFDRTTGRAVNSEFQIDCIAPFSAEVQCELRSLDRKYQRRPTIDQLKLSEPELKAILSIQPHVKQHQIMPEC